MRPPHSQIQRRPNSFINNPSSFLQQRFVPHPFSFRKLPLSTWCLRHAVVMKHAGRISIFYCSRSEFGVFGSQLKEDCHTLPSSFINSGADVPSLGVKPGWVIGIDPDTSGAVALLKSDKSCLSAQVFDNPVIKILAGKTVRKRLDPVSIIQLLHSFGAPPGTTTYIEQTNSFPTDGKQSWWCTGFGYGLWTGILIALGFSVVPISSLLWKKHFSLIGSSLTKDESRKVASILFPSLSSLFGRKKDHGRAEALLIAAYGKGLSLKPALGNEAWPAEKVDEQNSALI